MSITLVRKPIMLPKKYHDHLGPIIDHLDMENGPWLAGSSVASIVSGDPMNSISDYDIFFASNAQLQRVFEAVMKDMGWSRYNPELNVYPNRELTRDKAYTYTVQFVNKLWLPNVEILLNDFDFQICQFATDGRTVCGPQGAFDDARDKVLRLNQTNRDMRATPVRLAKYSLRGLTVEPSTITQYLRMAHERGTFTTGAYIY